MKEGRRKAPLLSRSSNVASDNQSASNHARADAALSKTPCAGVTANTARGGVRRCASAECAVILLPACYQATSPPAAVIKFLPV
jgi:hypothetical protein